MKNALAITSLFGFAFLCLIGCSEKKEAPTAQVKQVKNKAEAKKDPGSLPDGYPPELALPPGFSPRELKTGSGTISGGGKPDRSYKKFELWKMMPKSAPDLISHYKELLGKRGFEGEWKGDGKTNARGTFKKGDQEVELKINEERFQFVLKIFTK